jgi:hypothetical protein
LCSPEGIGAEVVEVVVANVDVEVSRHLLSPEIHSLWDSSMVGQLFKRMQSDTFD